ncbi:MAG: AbrB/MazE/SpoVT family DNA-binding domain-containing protein [Calditrichia bacterium]|nr:AbrB/MazE/SpoVT family DNA-binding domain-containing protein [Calditrichia bacterium]
MIKSKVKISRKGQIVIPSKIRNKLDTNLLEIIMDDNIIILQPVKSILNIAGSLNKYAQKSIMGNESKEVDEIAWEKHVKEKFDRS